MTQIRNGSTKPRIFYGWILVFVLLLILSVGVGTSMYMYSVMAGAFEQEFAAGRLALMMGSTGLILVLGLSSPVVGTLLDRYSSKVVLAVGALLMGLGFILIALSTQIWMVLASYIVFIGIGAATLSYLMAATLISRWFVKHRGLAIGIAGLGTQLGGFVYPPIFAAVMEAYNWRIAMTGVGILIMVFVPLIGWFTVVDRPEEMNQHPDGDLLPTTQSDIGTGIIAAPVPALSFSRLFTQCNFLLLIFIIGTATATNSVMMANLALFATDIGEPPVRGAFLVSLVALLGIFLSPLIGWLCDVINIKVMTAILSLSYAAACLLFSTASTYSMLVVATCFMGIGGGGVYPLWASMVGRLYHSRIYGQVMGLTTLVISIFTAAVLLFAGWAHDATNSYRLLCLVLLLVLVVMTLLITLIHVPRQPEKKFGTASINIVPAS